LYISLFTISLNILLAIWLALSIGMGVYGLALAAVIVSIVEVGILFLIMSRRIEGLFDKPFVHAIWRMISAAGFTAIVTYVLVSFMPLGAEDVFFSAFAKFSLIVGISASIYIIV